MRENSPWFVTSFQELLDELDTTESVSSNSNCH